MSPEMSAPTLPEALFEALPLPAIVHDRSTIRDVNARAVSVLAAQSPSDIIGRTINDIMHPDAREAGNERRRLLLDAGHSFAEVPVKLRLLNGCETRLNIAAVPFHVDSQPLALVVAAPEGRPFRVPVITATSLPEPSVSCVRSAALDALPLPLMTVCGRVVSYANPAACRLLRCAEQGGLQGREALDVLHPDSRIAMQERLESLSSHGSRPMHLPLKVLTDDGECIRMSCLAYAIMHDDLETFCFVITDAGS